MQTKTSNIVICPACGHENIEGSDNCENCLSDLRTIDVPDTFQVASDSDLTRELRQVRLSKAIAVAPNTTVREAIEALQKDASGAVVVVDGPDVVGIFTDRDVLKRVAGSPERFEAPVRDYMTPDPETLNDTDTMAAALNKMGDGGFRHIPVIERGQLTAMVTVRDVMQWLLGRYFDQGVH